MTTTKFDIVSDIHLEVGPCFITNKSGADTLILAGDIFDSYTHQLFPEKITTFFDRVCDQYSHVVLILGNHEHYGTLDFHNTYKVIDQFLSPHYVNLYILDNEQIRINGVTILGGTGWTNFNNANPVVMATAGFTMNDYNHINCGSVKLKPSDVLTEHNKWKSCIESQKTLFNQNEKCIIVTHHAPSFQSVHPRYEKVDPINFAYCNDFEYFAQNMSGLKYWVHGHVHDNFYYELSDTCKVVCNPRGYIGHEVQASHFEPITIEV